MSCLIKLWTIHIIHFTRCFRQNPRQRNVINLDNVLMIDSCQHIMDTCLTVILLHDYCTQTYINLHKLFTLHCNLICVLSVVIIKTDDDDDDDDSNITSIWQLYIRLLLQILDNSFIKITWLFRSTRHETRRDPKFYTLKCWIRHCSEACIANYSRCEGGGCACWTEASPLDDSQRREACTMRSLVITGWWLLPLRCTSAHPSFSSVAV